METMTEMETFWQQLIYGSGAFLFVAIFLSILFLVSYKVKYFSLISIGLVVYQAINYMNQSDITNLSFPIIILWISTFFFGFKLSLDLRK